MKDYHMKTPLNAMLGVWVLGLTAGFAQPLLPPPQPPAAAQRTVLRPLVLNLDTSAFARPPESQLDAINLVKYWPEASQKIAHQMIEKYGVPAEATQSMLCWEKNGPWKRTVVRRYSTAHNFPSPHEDILEQTIDYRVPRGKFDELAAFDGSLIIDRTKGELTARCDTEAANMLALNLADEVVTGKRVVISAREEFARQLSVATTKEAPLTEKLVVLSPTSEAADPDAPVAAQQKDPDKAKPGR
jgi:hypothetical protein